VAETGIALTTDGFRRMSRAVRIVEKQKGLGRRSRRGHGGGSVPLGTPVGTPVMAKITAVTEDTTPECLHTYKAKGLDGREITEFTTPINERDADVLYNAAAVDDWCMMWWDADGTGYIWAITEIEDTVLDS